MTWLSILTAAIAPGIALLAYFYLKDRYDDEPIHMVAKMFLFGFLLVFPIIVLQRALTDGFADNEFLMAFVLSAGIEEFFKWFLLYYIIFRHSVFDEPYDGIVYAVAISLGFATMENIIYAFANYTSFSSLLLRALLPVSGHALFGVMMGYHMGKAKFDQNRQVRYLSYSLLLPILWHGVFDYILLGVVTNWIWYMLPLMTFLWFRSIWKVNRANARSPFRVVRKEEEIKI